MERRAVVGARPSLTRLQLILLAAASSTTDLFILETWTNTLCQRLNLQKLTHAGTQSTPCALQSSPKNR